MKRSSEAVSSTTVRPNPPTVQQTEEVQATPIPPTVQQTEKVQAILKEEASRTWTFIEDGVMRCPSGGAETAWSFKKNGRLDAAFIGLQDTNVVLLAEDGTHRVIPATSLSENDRAYLKEARGISEEQAADIQKRAVANSAESIRRSEIARMRAEATIKRRAAELEIEAGKQLERDGVRHAGKMGGAATVRIYGNVRAQSDPTLRAVTAEANAELRKDAADRAEENRTNARRQAGVKFANANRLNREADELEARAAAMESGPASR